jgi:hypothetical protein
MRQVRFVLAMKKIMAVGIGLMGCIWLLMGCAEVAVTGAMAGAGEYYRYTAIFVFMLKRACRIICTGAVKTFTGLKTNDLAFSNHILAMTQRTSPSLSVAIDSRRHIAFSDR